jgi:hypothetical protein
MPSEGPRPPIEPLRLVHHHPGRLRVRAEALRDDPALAERMRGALAEEPAVRAVTHNPQTGSLLVEYHVGEIEPDELLSALAAAGGFAGVVDEANLRGQHEDIALAVFRVAERINGATRDLTAGRTDMGGIVPAALLAAAGYYFVRHPVVPRWDNLLYWAYVIFLGHNRDKVSAARERDPVPTAR